jgi:hypothetical protein
MSRGNKGGLWHTKPGGPYRIPQAKNEQVFPLPPMGALARRKGVSRLTRGHARGKAVFLLAELSRTHEGSRFQDVLEAWKRLRMIGQP